MSKLTIVLALVALFALVTARPRIDPGAVDVVNEDPGAVSVVDGDQQVNIVDNGDQVSVIDDGGSQPR